MFYILKALHFLNDYSLVILPTVFVALHVFGFANWLSNPYRKQNKKMIACAKSVRAYPDKAPTYVHSLPDEYRRQWRAFVNCGTDKPALVFEFVPLTKKFCARWFFVITTTISSLYVAVFVLIEHSLAYLMFQLVYMLTFALIMIVNKVVSQRYERHARQLFAQFVTTLNRATPKSSGTVVEDTVRQLKQLNRQEVNDEVVGKASELLRNKGLENDRTVTQQRKLNNALNSLLQAYANGAKNKA